jgi:hypothetical protein
MQSSETQTIGLEDTTEITDVSYGTGQLSAIFQIHLPDPTK